MKFIVSFLLVVCVSLLISPSVVWAADSSTNDGSIEDVGTVIGIDLGTTYSCVAVLKKGQVNIIANDLGNRVTPSYVAFTDSERLIGEAAKTQAAANPENTVFDVKRLMGRRFSDETVQKDRGFMPYTVTNNNEKPNIEVNFKGEARVFSPEEISAIILTRMKESAESFLGKRVTHAVITVPAYFNDAQRQATKDAATIAGLTVARLINEPTAAAIAYGMNEVEEKTILVFDLGGGTFDVTVLNVESGVFEVLSTNGDTHLGGEDFDQRVITHLLQHWKKTTGIDASQDARAVQKLRREVEHAKRTLSSQQRARIEIEGFHNGEDFAYTLTRARFEDLNMDLFRKTLSPVDQALKDAGLSKHQIDDVVLVGGSTRIPKVQQMLKDYFGKEPSRGINPDEAVAFGAAIQAGIISQEEGMEDIICVDIVPLSLGIETVGGIMSPVITKGTHTPARQSQTFSTHQNGQDRVLIRVHEGERSMTKDNHLLGSFELGGIPPSPRGEPQIEVTFDVDVNGILHVSAEEMSTGVKEEVVISSDQRNLSDADIQRMVREAEEAAAEDQVSRETVEARNALESYAFRVSSLADDEKMDTVARAEVKSAVAQALEWLDESPLATKEEFEDQFRQLQESVAPILESLSSEGAGMPDFTGEF